jgi:hypothetical protein
MWCCKVCDGEIPDGHTNNCDIWKLEKKHRDFIANAYNAVLRERDRLRKSLDRQTHWVQAALDCKTWVWDSDQRLAAMGCVIEAKELLGSPADASADHG